MPYVNVKVHDNRCFCVNVNKTSFPAIVPEQPESASFVMLVEIHNVDVPAASNRDATVLLDTALTLQWPSAIAVDFEIEFDFGLRFTYIIGVSALLLAAASRLLKENSKGSQTTND